MITQIYHDRVKIKTKQFFEFLLGMDDYAMPTEYKHVFQLRPNVLDHFGGAKVDLLPVTIPRLSTLIR